MDLTRTHLVLAVLGAVLALVLAGLVGAATAFLGIRAGESLPNAALKGGRAFAGTLMLVIAAAALGVSAFGR
ncbi:hypothetical protein ACGFMM_17860 [Streptomyces sp. NPDC048604]|uniref:hypothetical protein n=1 Tax=Streptomyces sp. NPDC048604 TaxID=3365578 RepID=UPI0037212E42